MVKVVDVSRLHLAPDFVKKTETDLVQVVHALGKVRVSLDLTQVGQNVLVKVYEVFGALSWRHQRIDQFVSDRDSSHGVKVPRVRFLTVPVTLNSL